MRPEFPDALEAERKWVTVALRRLKVQEDRVSDTYITEVMDLDRYKGEMEKPRQRRAEMEQATKDMNG